MNKSICLRFLLFLGIILATPIVSCREGDNQLREDPGVIGNSYAWGPIYIISLDNISSNWDVCPLSSTTKWADLNLMLKWNHWGEDKEISSYQKAYAEALEDAVHSAGYRAHWVYVQKQIDKARINHLEEDPYVSEWIDAEVKTGIVVTADKVLFGRDVGTNLADCFTASSIICYINENNLEEILLNDHYRYVVYSYPQFEVSSSHSKQERELTLTELFPVHTASIPRCIIHLKEIPKEEYDEITFSFSITLRGESLLSYSTIPIKESFEKETTKTLRGSITIRFQFD